MPNILKPLALAGALVVGLAVGGPAFAPEVSVDRPGGDYTNFDQRTADPGECEAACANDGRCRAWTFVRPGVQGPSARCWLKDQVPAPTNNSCCTSGVKTQLFQSRWDKASGPGDPWTTGWVPNMPAQVCGHSAGCACGGANYCGDYQNGQTAPYWPEGCDGRQWIIRCTSVPQP